MPGQSLSAIQEPLVPSINFAMVCPGVYRSGYPTRKNYCFLRALRLRTILYLCPEDYAESNVRFCEENNITILQFSTEGNKEPFLDISEPLMHRILSTLIDTRTHPILIHCNKGKHRTGTVVACLRLLQGWSLVSIFQEYRTFAGDKVRMGDQQYVELYHPIVRVTLPYVAEWVCITRLVTVVRTEQELLEAESRQLGWSLVAPTSEQQQQQEESKKEPQSSPSPVQEGRQLQQQQPRQQQQVSPFLPKKGAARHFVEHVDNEAARPVRLPAAIAAPRRFGGNNDLGGTGGTPAKMKETAVTVKKENGESKRSQK